MTPEQFRERFGYLAGLEIGGITAAAAASCWYMHERLALLADLVVAIHSGLRRVRPGRPDSDPGRHLAAVGGGCGTGGSASPTWPRSRSSPGGACSTFACPLTTWETGCGLRRPIGEAGHVHRRPGARCMFIDAPPWAFTVAYMVFACWWSRLCGCRRRTGSRDHIDRSFVFPLICPASPALTSARRPPMPIPRPSQRRRVCRKPSASRFFISIRIAIRSSISTNANATAPLRGWSIGCAPAAPEALAFSKSAVTCSTCCRYSWIRRIHVTRCDAHANGDNDPNYVCIMPGEVLPFDDGAFDGVVAVEVLEHVPARWASYVHCRVLSRGGGGSCSRVRMERRPSPSGGHRLGGLSIAARRPASVSEPTSRVWAADRSGSTLDPADLDVPFAVEPNVPLAHGSRRSCLASGCSKIASCGGAGRNWFERLTHRNAPAMGRGIARFTFVRRCSRKPPRSKASAMPMSATATRSISPPCCGKARHCRSVHRIAGFQHRSEPASLRAIIAEQQAASRRSPDR